MKIFSIAYLPLHVIQTCSYGFIRGKLHLLNWIGSLFSIPFFTHIMTSQNEKNKIRKCPDTVPVAIAGTGTHVRTHTHLLTQNHNFLLYFQTVFYCELITNIILSTFIQPYFTFHSCICLLPNISIYTKMLTSQFYVRFWNEQNKKTEHKIQFLLFIFNWIDCVRRKCLRQLTVPIWESL